MNTLADTIAAMRKEQKITGERKMSESLIPHEVVAKMSYAQQELAVVCMEMMNKAAAKRREVKRRTASAYIHLLPNPYGPITNAENIIRQIAEKLQAGNLGAPELKELKLKIRAAKEVLKSTEQVLEEHLVAYYAARRAEYRAEHPDENDDD
jgi:hypothetical protein